MINYYSNIILLLLLAYYLRRLYGKRAFLHPGLWFALLWISSTVSYLLCISISVYPEYFPRYIESLNVKIFFTGVAFFVFTLLGRVQKCKQFGSKPFNLNHYIRVYGICSIIAMFGAVGTWVSKGASFNIVYNRFAMIDYNKEMAMGYATAGQSMVTGILHKLYLLNIPCCLLAGSILALTLKNNTRKLTRAEIIFISIPFISVCIMTLTDGGRKGYLDVFMYYSIGFFMSFSFMKQFNKKWFKNFLIAGIVFILSFMIFSTTVRKARTAARYGAQYATTILQDNFSFLEPISGVIIYLADPFVGYQIKYKYTMNNTLSYGEKTFNGVFGFSIPVVERLLGFPISIGDYLGWKKLQNTRWILDNTPMASTVESIYFHIVDDFGEKGSLVAIFVLVFTSQLIFNSFFSRKRKRWTFLSIYLLFIFLIFWMNSIFSGIFSGNMPGAILKVFIFYQIFNHFAKYKRYDFSFGLFKSFLLRKERDIPMKHYTNIPKQLFTEKSSHAL